MRAIFNFFASIFGLGSGKETSTRKSRLTGMYLAEANELARTQFDVRRNRERQHGKSFTNRERA